MTDFIRLILRAGSGGKGKISFRREKYAPKGGPDGGAGGNGGNIILMADKSLATLGGFAGKDYFEAENGTAGGSRRKIGGKGQNLVIRVPLGTQITLEKENQVANKRRRQFGFDHLLEKKEIKRTVYLSGWERDENPQELNKHQLRQQELAESTDLIALDEPVIAVTLAEDGQEFVICQGGFGGQGNEYFKSSTRTTPMMAELGTVGEHRQVTLELKLLADVGLVGLPNAGKSTLLSTITKARPKVASYPFTTLEPHLGIFSLQSNGQEGERKELVIADIPGLIEGASQGKGLGHDFLRHIENCKHLIYLLYLEEQQAVDENISDQDKAKIIHDQYQTLKNELNSHNPELLEKPAWIVVNKLDLLSESLVGEIKKIFTEPLMFISAATGDGLSEFRNKLARI